MKKIFLSLTILSVVGLCSCNTYQRSETTTFGKPNPVVQEYTKCSTCRGLGSCTACKGTGKISGNTCGTCKGNGRCLSCAGKGVI